MYSFVKSVCLARSIGSQWTEKNISGDVVYSIFNTYVKVYLVLSHPDLTENVFVDMDSLRLEFSTYTGTLNQLLVTLDNRTLPTVASLPSTQTKYVRYSDAFRAEYKIDATIIGQILPPQYPRLGLPDLELSRPKYDTNLSLVHSHCLVSVNGFFHRTDTDGNKAYVYDGAKSLQKSKNNQIGILSFLDIGSVEKIQISKDDINAEAPDKFLKDKIIFQVPNDLEDKSYILVLGGYLVFPQEGVFWRSGDQSFTLDIKKLPYVERLFESNLYLDLSGLELTESPIGSDNYNMDEIYSDRVIKNYMTLSQSFLVVVDTEYLITNKIHIRHSDLPGMFTAYQDPRYPLIVGYGRAAEYWKVQEDGFWAVSIQDSYLRNYMFNQNPWPSLENITDHLQPYPPALYSRGYLLEIGGYKTI
jgi:hypothetical protein